jgi:enoyl-CoA hydratase/carnithine racemase
LTHYEHILVSTDEHIGTIRINRPQVMNAGTIQTWAEINAALDEFERDDDVRVVIITGAGRAFCAGDDVKENFVRAQEEGGFGVSVEDEADALRRHEPVALDRILTYPKPTIASINGAAVGYGCDIALMCDIRIAGESARMGELFVRRGLIPAAGGLVALPMLVGWERAHELVYTGDILDAAEASRIGMVSHLVPDEKLEEETLALARRIAAQAPLAQRMAKEAFHIAHIRDLQPYFDFERKAQELMFKTADHREGVMSFLEKRPAQFTGR